MMNPQDIVKDDISFSSASHNDSESGMSATSATSKLSKEDQDQLAARENKLVRRSRIVFGLFLLTLTAAAVGMTYYFTKKGETQTFEEEFNMYAREILYNTETNVRNDYIALGGFSATVSSFSLESQVSWPNITLPHYPERASHILEFTGIEHVLLCPVVAASEKEEWEMYSGEHYEWIKGTGNYTDTAVDELFHSSISSEASQHDIETVIELISDTTSHDHTHDSDGKWEGRHVPMWQMYPMAEKDINIVNFDMMSYPTFLRLFHYVELTKQPILSEVIDIPALLGFSSFGVTDLHDETIPHIIMMQPVFKGIPNCERAECTEEEASVDVADIGAVAVVIIPWDTLLSGLLPDEVNSLIVVIRNTCGDEFTFMIEGRKAIFVDDGDLHNSAYDHLEETIFLETYGPTTETNVSSLRCTYSLHVYPTTSFEAVYETSRPATLAVAVALIFIFTTGLFIMYDCLVQRRQEKVMESALKTNAIVASLFPKEVKERLLRAEQKNKGENKPGNFINGFNVPTVQNDMTGDLVDIHDRPIADLFLNATVMFADIAGFTAWSSVRDPIQVFTLLETLYKAFDRMARKRRVFKVETIGDSYVAVCGLPDPNPNHAIVMARFARDVIHKMNELTTRLEEILGPGTAELKMRVGLNSGPVTAGVLRGEKSRFQLFGDTVNTAARMESNGEKNRIQISQSTADEISKKGKEHWFEPRKELIHAKGKGDMQTYWLNFKDDNRTASISDVSYHLSRKPSSEAMTDAKKERMVSWASEILSNHLKQIVSARELSSTRPKHDDGELQRLERSLERLERSLGHGEITVLEEATDFLPIRPFDQNTAEHLQIASAVKLDAVVMDQLRTYVHDVVNMYRDNPFHNMDHAVHVTMSISKLLGRINSTNPANGDESNDGQSTLRQLHERTYGITSDPLVQFAAVFSGLIHDADHRGVPNFVLMKEDQAMSSLYKNRSIAESNSVDLAWGRLMESDMKDLRRCIAATPAELKRFRQALVNIVLATDIFDKDCASVRKHRWEKHFGSIAKESGHDLDSDGDDIVRHQKAEIVLEHLIQASDVAHTMQHWNIYQKWNKKLFEEMYRAHKSGRMPGKNPADGWYEGELAFFDNYIIPLAKKLKQCGSVFGVSSDEYLNYALANRQEWERRGQEVVRASVATFDEDEQEAATADSSASCSSFSSK